MSADMAAQVEQLAAQMAGLRRECARAVAELGDDRAFELLVDRLGSEPRPILAGLLSRLLVDIASEVVET